MESDYVLLFWMPEISSQQKSKNISSMEFDTIFRLFCSEITPGHFGLTGPPLIYSK